DVAIADQPAGGGGRGDGSLVVSLALADRVVFQTVEIGGAGGGALATGERRGGAEALAGGEHGVRVSVAAGAQPGAGGSRGAGVTGASERTADGVGEGLHGGGLAGGAVGAPGHPGGPGQNAAGP